MSWSDDFIASNLPAQLPNQQSAAVATTPSAASSQSAQVSAGAPPVLGGFMTGVGDAVGGTVQGLTHAISWAANKIAPDSQFAKDAREGVSQVDARVKQVGANYDAKRAASGDTGIDWARLVGNMVGTAPSLAVGPEYSGLGLLGRIGLGTAQGAVGAGMMPATDDSQSYADQKLAQLGIGAAGGAALPVGAGVTRGVGGALWDAARPVIAPNRFVGQGLAGAMNPAEAATAAANIRNAQQFVPGSVPTTAQAAQTPVMVMTEKAAGNTPAFKAQFTDRTISNNDARWQALMGVAQDPATLSAAEQARSAAAAPLYSTAHQNTANVGPAFMRYAQIPEMQEAMQRANANASLDAAVGRGVAPVWPTQNSNSINGAALDYTSRALDDMIGEAQRTGNNTRAASLKALQSKVDNWTNTYVPGVKQASDTYAQMSVPVNTMQAGQQIANSLGTRAMNAGGVPEIQLNPYRTALTQAMKKAQFGIDPTAQGTLQGIGQDLQRATVSNSIRQPGADTAYNLEAKGWLGKQLYGPTFSGSTGLGRAVAGIGSAIAGHPWAGVGIAGGMGRIGQTVGSRLQDKLTNYLLDPAAILPYLDARAAASANQSMPGPVVRGLLNYGRPTVVNGLLGGLIGPTQ